MDRQEIVDFLEFQLDSQGLSIFQLLGWSVIQINASDDPILELNEMIEVFIHALRQI